MRPDNQYCVQELAQQMSSSDTLILIDYGQMNAQLFLDLRRKLRTVNTDCQVVKNSIFQRVAQTLNKTVDESLLKGPTAVIYGTQESVVIAKELFKFIKETNAMTIKGGVVDNVPCKAADIETFAKLPSKKELQAKLVGVMVGPLVRTVSVMKNMVQNFVGVLDAVKNKKTAE